MDARKILKDLQYRIDTAPDDDPEKENAIRLRDRLLAKNGLRLEDITEVRTERTFDKLSREESSMVCQYFRKKMKIKFDEAPHFLNSYQYRKKKTKFRNFVRIQLTDDEFLQHWKAVESLVAIHRRKMRELEKQLKKEAEARRQALEYAIYERAGILFPAGWNGNESQEASWSFRDAMAAAEALSDTLFPQMQVEQETLRLAKES